jgi:hypothetical protein
MVRAKNPTKSTPKTAALDPERLETPPQAFASLLAEIEAVPADELVHIYVDIPRAARCGLLAAENLAPFFPELAKLGPWLDVRPIRMLRPYSLALLHAHDLAVEGGSEAPSLSVLVAEATPLREGLLRTAELLAHYGLVSAERVAAIRHGSGYADLADDVLALGRLFVELWPKVHDKVVVTREEVDRAIVLSPQLQEALARHESEQGPVSKDKGRRFVRGQAFTLFHRAYQETRRGITFLRWHEGDALAIVPPLRASKSRRPGAEEDDAGAEELLEPSVVDGDDEPVAPSVMATDALADA